MTEITEWRKNELGYPHVVCLDCHGESFYIRIEEEDKPKFYSIICTNCSNEIFCNLQPVFGPAVGS